MQMTTKIKSNYAITKLVNHLTNVSINNMNIILKIMKLNTSRRENTFSRIKIRIGKFLGINYYIAIFSE